MTESVTLIEVGPRDGLQNETTLLSLETKIALITRLVQAGASRIETASFVHPKWVPAMADSDQVMKQFNQDRIRNSCSAIGLALNSRGVERALAAGCDEINYAMSIGESFSIKNQNMTPIQALELLDTLLPQIRREGKFLSVTLSTCFGDPYEGEISESRVIDTVLAVTEKGVDEIVLADTIGVADPWSTRKLLRTLKRALGKAFSSVQLRVHFHNTRNTALANIYTAIEEGIRNIDTSCGGIGGCPYAPQATGNVATEDVVYMLERAGIKTGFSLEKLIETTHWLEHQLAHPAPSLLARSGGFPPKVKEKFRK